MAIDGAVNGWKPYNWQSQLSFSDAIINPLAKPANADLYPGDDTVYVAANNDTQGVVKQGDVLIEANTNAPKKDYDVNGDGKVDKRVTINGKDYYVIETGADNAALVAKFGPGTYLPVVNRDVTGDGVADTGYIRIKANGDKSFVTNTDMTITDLRNPTGASAEQKEALKRLDDNNDGFAWVGNTGTYTAGGITYTATVTGYTDNDGDGVQDKGEPMIITIVAEQPLT